MLYQLSYPGADCTVPPLQDSGGAHPAGALVRRAASLAGTVRSTMKLRTTTWRTGAALLLAASATGLAACGDSDSGSASKTTVNNIAITSATI